MKSSHLIMRLVLAQVLCLFISHVAFAQTETLGIVRYTPPKGWTKTAKENIVVFSTINQSTNGYCFITLYGATPGTGNPQKDFSREWNNLVVKPFGAEANPITNNLCLCLS